MSICPRCDRSADRLHSLPPEVITRGLIERLGSDDGEREIRICGECIHALMEG